MHKTLSVVMVGALAVVAAGCGPYTGGPIPTGATVYDIVPGASTLIPPGQAGYAITANTGGSYRLVWTGDTGTSGVRRSFQGSVWTPGRFNTVTAGCIGGGCAVEGNDTVKTPVAITGGERVDFDANTAEGVDGFDMTVTFEPVYFDLIIDGQRYPELVFFSSAALGGQVATAGTMPFGLQGT